MTSDRGSVTLWLVIFAFTVLVLLGFVVDGGQYMNARERAADIAQQAARAAVDDLSPGALRDQTFVIQPDACQPGGPAYELVGAYAGNGAVIAPNGCAIGGLTAGGDCQQAPNPLPPGGFRPCAKVTVNITVTPAIPIGVFGTVTTFASEQATLACGSDAKTGVC